eukprot:s1992_g1.t1
MKVTPCTDPAPNFKGQTLVLPGIANLGELSADALIATYGLQRVENKHLLPVAMVNAFGSESPAVTTAAEIYQDVHDSRCTTEMTSLEEMVRKGNQPQMAELS